MSAISLRDFQGDSLNDLLLGLLSQSHSDPRHSIYRLDFLPSFVCRSTGDKTGTV